MSEAEEEFDKAVLNGEYQKAMGLMNKLWLDTMIYLTMKDKPDLKELNYINVSIDTGDGEYIIALMHTKGKKLQLKTTEAKSE